ncbi:RND family efflux transporter MFP subunit [Aestuariispira insulae]|uniref:RND family efflux transporter MFP subunit n=2 Tax=Aestuariispira insulae TaxID=1461337 RepID=A0A3D9HSM9_9PROT|nr:RND family efflux transporter MFP subunit [Aestuariispira insulae]
MTVSGLKRVMGVATVAAVAMLFAAPALAQGKGFPALVDVDTVISQPLSQTMPVIGRFVARERGVVSSLTAGPVAAVEVEVGERVEAGQVLIRLDDAVITQERNLEAAAVKQSRAELSTAKEALGLALQEQKRLERLKGSAAFSQARLDDKKKEVARLRSEQAEAEAAVAKSQASLALAEIDLKRTRVLAPFNGVVIERHTERGAYLSAGGNVVTLLNDEDMEVEADVPANRIAGLTPGRLVEIELVAGENQQAIVRAVVPDENVLTRTRAVRFTPAAKATEPGALAAGQSVTVFIPVGTAREIVSVHKDAVLPQGGRNRVYVVRNGVAEIREITYGEAVGDRLEVLSGLEPGDVTVIRGNERIQPGQEVTYQGMPGNGTGG